MHNRFIFFAIHPSIGFKKSQIKPVKSPNIRLGIVPEGELSLVNSPNMTMLDVPGKDTEISRENFEKAISMLTVSITGWIEEQVAKDGNQALNKRETTQKANLLLQATDHLRQYGITGARATSTAVLTIASMWAQSQVQAGIATPEQQKEQMMWVMKAPPVHAAIQETFKTLDEESKRDAENFARGTEQIINTFVACTLNKYFPDTENKPSDANNSMSESLKEIRGFFDAIDEGGLTYIAKVLELVTPTVMLSNAFNQGSDQTVSDYYQYTLELMQDILSIEENSKKDEQVL